MVRNLNFDSKGIDKIETPALWFLTPMSFCWICRGSVVAFHQSKCAPNTHTWTLLLIPSPETQHHALTAASTPHPGELFTRFLYDFQGHFRPGSFCSNSNGGEPGPNTCASPGKSGFFCTLVDLRDRTESKRPTGGCCRDRKQDTRWTLQIRTWLLPLLFLKGIFR
jgi:hypothetical protein